MIDRIEQLYSFSSGFRNLERDGPILPGLQFQIRISCPEFVSRCRYANPTECRLPLVSSGKECFGYFILPGVITPGYTMNPLRGTWNFENLIVSSIAD